MTAAPDAQPPAGLWWSAKHNAVVAKHPYGECYDLIEQDPMGWRDTEELSALPADAVRLVADEMAADILDANERLGEALVEIGMALGLPAPRTGATWGAPEILARIAASPASAALDGTPAEPDAETIEKLANAIYACDSEPPLNARTVPERWAVYQAQARNIVWPVVAALLASTPTRTAQEG